MFKLIIVGIIAAVVIFLAVLDAVDTHIRRAVRVVDNAPYSDSVLTRGDVKAIEAGKAEAGKLIAIRYRAKLADKYGVEPREVTHAHVFKEFAAGMDSTDKRRAGHLMDMLDAEVGTNA